MGTVEKERERERGKTDLATLLDEKEDRKRTKRLSLLVYTSTLVFWVLVQLCSD